jgi:hypothetical protein
VCRERGVELNGPLRSGLSSGLEEISQRELNQSDWEWFNAANKAGTGAMSLSEFLEFQGETSENSGLVKRFEQ